MAQPQFDREIIPAPPRTDRRGPYFNATARRRVRVDRLAALAARLRATPERTPPPGPPDGFVNDPLDEMVALDPDHWCLPPYDHGLPMLIVPGPWSTGPYSDAAHYFGVHFDAAAHLLIPYAQDPREFGGIRLGYRAMRTALADNIDALLRIVQERPEETCPAFN